MIIMLQLNFSRRGRKLFLVSGDINLVNLLALQECTCTPYKHCMVIIQGYKARDHPTN